MSSEKHKGLIFFKKKNFSFSHSSARLFLKAIKIKQKNQCFIFGTAVADCSSAEWGIPLVLALLIFVGPG